MIIKRPMLSTDCRALSRLTKMMKSDPVSECDLTWHIGQKNVSGILYEHEIEGVAHPVAFVTWARRAKAKDLLITSFACHLEYDGGKLYPMLLGHVMRRLSPKYSAVTLEINADEKELVDALFSMGFTSVHSTVFSGKNWIEFSYGVRV